MKINQLLEATDITQTPAFKKWFGNSKIVDNNGKPLKVYHGTTANFDVFTPALGGAVGGGIYLATDPDDAAKYIDRGSNRVDAEGGHIIPLYASIKNPLMIDVVMIRGSEHCIINGEPYRYREIPKDFATGHDGLVIHYNWEGYDNTNIVAFSPNQVKSIHNKGAFSNSPNILESAINEARTAPLYHATSITTAAEIIKSNELHGNSFHKLKGKEYNGISLTRSLQFAKYWVGGGEASETATGVILILDQEKISHSYKFLPIDYFSTDQAPKPADSSSAGKYKRRQGVAAEAEEFLLTTNLKNLDKYLTGILITKRNFDNAKNRLTNGFTKQDEKDNINFILNHPKLKVI